MVPSSNSLRFSSSQNSVVSQTVNLSPITFNTQSFTTAIVVSAVNNNGASTSNIFFQMTLLSATTGTVYATKRYPSSSGSFALVPLDIMQPLQLGMSSSDVVSAIGTPNVQMRVDIGGYDSSGLPGQLGPVVLTVTLIRVEGSTSSQLLTNADFAQGTAGWTSSPSSFAAACSLTSGSQPCIGAMPTVTPTPGGSTTGGSSGSSSSIIIPVVVGVIGGLALLAVVVFVMMKKRRGKAGRFSAAKSDLLPSYRGDGMTADKGVYENGTYDDAGKTNANPFMTPVTSPSSSSSSSSNRNSMYSKDEQSGGFDIRGLAQRQFLSSGRHGDIQKAVYVVGFYGCVCCVCVRCVCMCACVRVFDFEFFVCLMASSFCACYGVVDFFKSNIELFASLSSPFNLFFFEFFFLSKQHLQAQKTIVAVWTLKNTATLLEKKQFENDVLLLQRIGSKCDNLIG